MMEWSLCTLPAHDVFQYRFGKREEMILSLEKIHLSDFQLEAWNESHAQNH